MFAISFLGLGPVKMTFKEKLFLTLSSKQCDRTVEFKVAQCFTKVAQKEGFYTNRDIFSNIPKTKQIVGLLL